MTTQTTPREMQGRTPGSSGDAAQKLRLDALQLALTHGLTVDDALDAARWVETGELPEEDEDA